MNKIIEIQRKYAWSGIALIVMALQILPISDVMAKYTGQLLPVLQVIWARFFFHCILTGAYSFFKYGADSIIPKPGGILFLRGAALFTAVALFYLTMHFLPLTTTLTLWFIEPFILTILAVVFYKEKVSKGVWLAVAIGFVGVLIANRPDLVSFHWSYLTGLAAGVAYAVFLLLTRSIDKDTPPIVSVYHTGLVGCFISSFIVPFVWTPPTSVQWGLLIGIGLIAAIAHLLIVWAFSKAKASTLAPFTYSEIFAATVVSYFVFNHVPNTWTILGLAVIVCSGILIAMTNTSNE